MKVPKDETGFIGIVARNVRQARKDLGLSQEALAHEAGIDRTYVSQVERRQRNMTITMLARFAAALATTPDRLLIETPNTTTRAVPRKQPRR